MGRVVAAIVAEDDVLLVLAALDDLRGAGSQLALDLVDDGDDKGGDDGEDKDGQLVLDLLDELGQDGDLLDGFGDLHDNLVVELDDGHDLLEDLLDVAGKLLGLARRDTHVLHLGRVRVVLNVVHLLLVPAAQDAIRDLVQEILKKAGILRLAVLQGALELLDLVLGQFVGHYEGLDV